MTKIETIFSLNIKHIKKIVFGIIGIVVIPYLVNFFGYCISDNPVDWGVFGDYIGGILNPLLAIINIILLIQLSYNVEIKEDLRRFNEIKYKAYTELTNTLFDFDIKNVAFDKAEIPKVKKLHSYLEIFELTNDFLFENDDLTIFKSLMHSIKHNVDSIKGTLGTFSKFDPNKVYEDSNQRRTSMGLSEKGQKQLEMIKILQVNYERFLLGFFQSSLTKKNIKNYDLNAKSKFESEMNEIKNLLSPWRN